MHPKTRKLILDQIDVLVDECDRLERRISCREDRIACLNQLLIDDDEALGVPHGCR